MPLASRPKSPGGYDPAGERLARVLTWVRTLAAVVAVALWILRITGPLTVVPVIVFEALNIPVTPSLVSVILVALVAAALMRRMRLALVAVMVFSVFGTTVSLLILTDNWIWNASTHGMFPYAVHMIIEATGIVVGGLTLVAAVRSWKAFPARTRRGAIWVAAVIGTAGLAVALVLTQALIVATTQAGWTQFNELGRVFWAAMGSHQGGWRHIDAVPPWVQEIIAILLALVLVITVWTLLRAGRRSAQWTGDGEIKLRELLAGHGDLDSLGWFATRRDKEAVFSPDGRAAVTFRTIGSVSLASGDPVGDPAAWPHAIAEWKAHARTYGYLLGVVSASEAGARAYANRDAEGAGLAVTSMGDEAVLHADRFTLGSTDMTEVRRAVRRARRDGLTATVEHHRDLESGELAHLGVLADR